MRAQAYEVMLASKTDELKAVEEEVRRLNGEFGKLQTYDILKQLKTKRAELSNLKAEQLSGQAVICRDFIRRFEQLLSGKRPHPKWFATHCLRELALQNVWNQKHPKNHNSHRQYIN